MITMMELRKGIYAASGRKTKKGHLYWRINVTGTNDTQGAASRVATLAEIQLRTVPGVAVNMNALGSPSASTTFSATYTADKAIDASTSTGWICASGGWNGAKWQMSFSSPKEIKEIMLQGWNSSAFNAQMLSACDLQWSDNAVNWTSSGAVITGQTAWGLSEQRLFAVP